MMLVCQSHVIRILEIDLSTLSLGVRLKLHRVGLALKFLKRYGGGGGVVGWPQ